MAVTDVDYRLSVKDANTLATLNEVVKRVKEVNKEFKSLEKVNLNKTDCCKYTYFVTHSQLAGAPAIAAVFAVWDLFTDL